MSFLNDQFFKINRFLQFYHRTNIHIPALRNHDKFPYSSFL
jgi:hypothetical protein